MKKFIDIVFAALAVLGSFFIGFLIVTAIRGDFNTDEVEKDQYPCPFPKDECPIRDCWNFNQLHLDHTIELEMRGHYRWLDSMQLEINKMK